MKKTSPKKASRRTPRRSEAKAATQETDSYSQLQDQNDGFQAQRSPLFPVVGVGASAGGLQAFTELLKALPENPGMAFVLVAHLDPTHESAMTELLSRATKMRVLQASDRVPLEPNKVYVIPPDKDMTISDGVLRLAKRERQGTVHLPIDQFFRSLAEEMGNRAIGVVLSGTASDGTAGVAAIKGEGGFTIAQDTASAKWSGMPSSAISSGFIDLVLPPAKIAKELTRIREHPYVAKPKLEEHEPVSAEKTPSMVQLFRIIKQVCRADFFDYKPATIRRRILRRMALRHVENLGDYVKLLQEDFKEVEALYQDILINVTSFFRNPEAFRALREVVYPSILKDRAPSDTIRIWVPGCSTGEEAYSHAISLLEYLAEVRADVSVQIFATDLSVPAARKARMGFYKDNILADVSPERIKRFFTKMEGGYQISKSVRDMCVFANQNVFSDPPFSHVDLLSCRNVLIYLSHVLQKRVIPIFHYALSSNGFLMVGNTEGLLGTGAELFELVHKKHKIYRKRAVPSPVAFGISPERFDGRMTVAEHLAAPPPPDEAVRSPLELQREADRLLLARYVPAAVLTSADLEVLQTRGHAGQFLELPTGKASLNLLKMVKPSLLLELQAALDEARTSGQPVRKENLQAETDGNFTSVRLEVLPLVSPPNQVHSFLIIFDGESGSKTPVSVSSVFPPELEDAKDKLIAQLRHELVATKEYQQSIIEALEASNEELQSANEEIQSGNEELQSTNEELQTSKEELESANEELNTVNEEMQHRNHQLAQANNDLMNLLVSVNIPIIMLGPDLSIRRFTPKAEEVLGLRGSDVGRPLLHVRFKVNLPDFESMMLEVMRDGVARQREFLSGKTWYRMRITPYCVPEGNEEGNVEGAVAALFDITEFKRRPFERTKRSKPH